MVFTSSPHSYVFLTVNGTPNKDWAYEGSTASRLPPSFQTHVITILNTYEYYYTKTIVLPLRETGYSSFRSYDELLDESVLPQYFLPLPTHSKAIFLVVPILASFRLSILYTLILNELELY